MALYTQHIPASEIARNTGIIRTAFTNGKMKLSGMRFTSSCVNIGKPFLTEDQGHTNINIL